jgi:dihydrofolate synthase/folylpolyglutamate synthase
MWDQHEAILSEMDLQGEYQRKNLRTVLAALDVLQIVKGEELRKAIVETAQRTGFRGRWEKLADKPLTICDIGHNEHGLRHNFAQLERMKAEGKCSHLILVYGSVADKDVDAVLHLMPKDAIYIFTQAQSKRALQAERISEKYAQFCNETGRTLENIYVRDNVADAVSLAREIADGFIAADPTSNPLIYIGGSTYVVSEAVTL